MRNRILAKALVVASILASAVCAALADARPWTALTDAELANLRGSNPQLGKCTVTCAQYQGIKGQAGTWTCTGEVEGAPCSLCQTTGAITYADTSTGTSAPCPGNNYKDGAIQDCGKQTAEFSAMCKNGVCTGGTWSMTDCLDPLTAVPQ